MAKETYIRLRCTEEFKDQVNQAAKMDDRTTSNYMEHILKEDMKKKGILNEGGKDN